MSYFAVYDESSGEIQNVVECPDFLADSIHLDSGQSCIKVDQQVSPRKYLVSDGILIQKE